MMTYNLYISYRSGKYNLFGVSLEQLQIVVDAYLFGHPTFTIAGDRRNFQNVDSLQIFEHDVDGDPQKVADYYLNNIHFRQKGFGYYYLPPNTLLKMGKNVTFDFIQNFEYGDKNKQLVSNNSTKKLSDLFINKERLKELQTLQSSKFDFKRLIKLCDEINDNYANDNFMSVAMIGRTILNHVPPIFGLKNFEEIANNYGGSNNTSFKKNMIHLNSSLKNIADSYLHQQIRTKESLPNANQVDFKQDFDVLLSEIIRITH